MEQRQHAKHPIGAQRPFPEAQSGLFGIGGEIGVAKFGRLRHTGRAAGVLQHGDGIGVFAHGTEVAIVAHHVGGGDGAAILPKGRQIAPPGDAEHLASGPRQRLGHATDDNAAQPGGFGDARQLGVDRGEIDGDHEFGAGIGDLMREFPLDIKRIEIHHDAPGAQGREEKDHGIGRVRQAKTNASARHHTQRLQAFRGLVHSLVEFGVAPATTHEIDRAMHREIARRGRQ